MGVVGRGGGLVLCQQGWTAMAWMHTCDRMEGETAMACMHTCDRGVLCEAVCCGMLRRAAVGAW